MENVMCMSLDQRLVMFYDADADAVVWYHML